MTDKTKRGARPLFFYLISGIKTLSGTKRKYFRITCFITGYYFGGNYFPPLCETVMDSVHNGFGFHMISKLKHVEKNSREKRFRKFSP
ncbi:MAG TPA: hypothetical protein DEB43_03935 [Desulfovibrio sp.]|nr:hypothetical protein [Desulfovibrio sp.]